MKNKLFTGVATALATPFIDEKINFKVFEEFIELQINSGINALVVCGTTGEASTMSQNEKIDLIKCAISVTNKRVPIIVGTGSNNTLSAIEMSKIAEKLGADGLLVVTPYYNKTTQNGLIEHYKSISNSVSLPIILYNVPSRTGMNISPETCLELSKIENIVINKNTYLNRKMPFIVNSEQGLKEVTTSGYNETVSASTNARAVIYLKNKKQSS